ncbi:SWIM zinc finger family protein [Flavitalea sp.]|nr:SWIM zinc finger family protein [Flavitalea sp.]
MNLTEEQILTLAPDESSKKSGKDLANISKWITRGASDQALWGECQGSGSKPYQTQVDTGNIAFKCSCPSRKFPCKHGLGLLLLYSRNKNDFPIVDAPAWVADWLSKRTEKQAVQAEKKEKPVDEAAQSRRQEARLSKVSAGVEELTAWLKDIIRNGFLSIPEKGPAFFENMSRRLIDAQAPGLAALVRTLSETNFYAESWHSGFLDQLLRIYMIVEGFRNSSSIDESLQDDLRTWIGFTQNQDELKEKTGVMDTWLVLGKKVSETDTVTTEKFWLYGTQTNNYALLMQFIVRGQGAQFNLTPGMFVQAELIFFPSTIPQRALIKRQVATTAVTKFKTLENWQQVAESESRLNSILPFRSESAFVVSKLKLVKYNQQWWLQDAENALMPLKNEDRYIWKLLSLSGGQSVDMAVIGKEDQFEPLGVWQDDGYKII